jgi:hypothetical protein
MSNRSAAIANEDRAYYFKNLPEGHKTSENVQKCMCVGCDHFDQHKFSARRCPRRAECDRLREQGKVDCYKRRQGGHTLVLKADIIPYVLSGVVL